MILIATSMWVVELLALLPPRGRWVLPPHVISVSCALGWTLLVIWSGGGQSPFVVGYFLEIALAALRPSPAATGLATLVGFATLTVHGIVNRGSPAGVVAAAGSLSLLATGSVFVVLARRLTAGDPHADQQLQMAYAAHRIKNSLAAAAGFAEILNSDLAGDDARRSIAISVQAGIEEAHHRLQELMQPPEAADSLSRRPARFAGDDRGPHERAASATELRTAVERALMACNAVLRRARVQCHVEVPTTLTAAIPPDDLHHVLLDLIHNAVEAMGEQGGGQLSIVASPEGMGLIVQDTGPGIPGTVLRRAFLPWHTLKSNNGHGLGLAGTQNLLRRHGGSLHLANLPGASGARAEIRLPPSRPRQPSARD